MDKYYKKEGPFENFSDKELDAIAKRFQFSDEKPGSILKEYGFSFYPQEFTSRFPLKLREDIRCEYCGVPMYAKIASRSRAKQLYDEEVPCQKEDLKTHPGYYSENEGLYYYTAHCVKCGHFIYLISPGRSQLQKCTCPGCLAKSAEEERQRKIKEEEEQRQKEEKNAERRRVIREKYGTPRTKINDTDVNCFDMYKLADVCFHTHPYSMEKVFPDPDRDHFLTNRVKELYECGLLSVSAESPIEAFVWEENEIKEFYVDLVTYNINVDIDPSFARAFAREETSLTERFPIKEEETDRFLHQYKVMAVMDGIKNYKRLMSKRNLPSDVDAQDLVGFGELYTMDSYTKISSIIYTTVRYFADQYMQGKMKKDNIGSVAFHNIRPFYLRAKGNGWTIKDSDYGYAGKGLCFLIRNILGKELSILTEVPSKDWFIKD